MSLERYIRLIAIRGVGDADDGGRQALVDIADEVQALTAEYLATIEVLSGRVDPRRCAICGSAADVRLCAPVSYHLCRARSVPGEVWAHPDCWAFVPEEE